MLLTDEERPVARKILKWMEEKGWHTNHGIAGWGFYIPDQCMQAFKQGVADTTESESLNRTSEGALEETGIELEECKHWDGSDRADGRCHFEAPRECNYKRQEECPAYEEG